MLSGELGTNLIKVLNWANDPGIRGADVTLCLVAEALGEVVVELFAARGLLADP